MSDKDLMIELLEITEVKEGGKVDFTDRAKEIIMELAVKYMETPIYKQAKKEKPEWVNTATATEIYIQMCNRIAEAPTLMYMISSTKILIPILWKKIQEEEGKVYFTKTANMGTTQHAIEEMEKLMEFWEVAYGSS